MANESPAAFFNKITMPKGWKFIGRNDFDRSHGAIIQLTHDTWLRIFVLTDTCKGGIVEKKFDKAIRQFTYRCMVHNKSAEQLNEFIKTYYNEQSQK